MGTRVPLSMSTMTSRMATLHSSAKVCSEIQDERLSQEEKWGQQNHKDGTTILLLETANINRARTDQAAKEGTLTWAHILNEEFYEAMAEENQEKLRKELIQVAAVAVSWVECIDRRNGR